MGGSRMQKQASGFCCRFLVGLVVLVGALFAQLPSANAQTARQVTSDDWSDRIGLVIGAVVVVLIVNGIGMYFIARARDNERAVEGGRS